MSEKMRTRHAAPSFATYLSGVCFNKNSTPTNTTLSLIDAQVIDATPRPREQRRKLRRLGHRDLHRAFALVGVGEGHPARLEEEAAALADGR